jgi:hypothetical protein
MKIVVNTKTKKQEKAVKDLLTKLDLDYSVVEEEAAEYKTAPKKGKQKLIPSLQEENPIAIPEWQKQFVRKSVKKYNAHPELLISEKEAWKIIEGI